VNGENRILTANPTLLSMMGYSLDELIGRFASDFVAPEDIARRPLRTVDEFKVPGTVRHDRIAVRKDRRRLNVIVRSTYLPSGNLQYIIQDVTEQKRMEKSLRLSEERYRMVSSVISDYTFFTKVEEDDTLRMVWVGGAFEKITGYSPEEFEVHGGWISTLHPDDIPQDERDMAMLRSNQRIVSEVRTIRKDGATSWVRVYAHPMWDPDKHKLVGIYGAVQDINEQKRIEHERESLILQLEAKNAELEQFTYMVSHDLKAPIITIKGFLGFLSEDARNHNVERLQTDILRIGSAADKMHALLNDLLELSRIGRLINDPEPVDCRELVSEVEKLLSVRLKMRNITLRVGEQLPMLHGDRQRLFEVFQNLIENASKFMGEQQNPVIEVAQHGEPQDGMVTLYVRDNGIGIDPQHHDRVFGLFNRLDPQIDGTGVGLAIVRRIVEFHGGAVWLESAVGQGATFFFSLPCEK
jgi:PAS domain S-box-containing protein